MRKVAAEQGEELFLFSQKVDKGIDEKGTLGIGVYFEEGINNASSIALHHQHRQQRQFVLPRIAVRLGRCLGYVPYDLSGNFEGVRDILQQFRLVGLEKLQKFRVL